MKLVLIWYMDQFQKFPIEMNIIVAKISAIIVLDASNCPNCRNWTVPIFECFSSKKKKLFLFLDLYVLSYPGSISLIGQATPDQEPIYPIQESLDHKSLLWRNQHLSLWT